MKSRYTAGPRLSTSTAPPHDQVQQRVGDAHFTISVWDPFPGARYTLRRKASLLHRLLAQFHRPATTFAQVLLAALDRANVAPVIDLVGLPLDQASHRQHPHDLT